MKFHLKNSAVHFVCWVVIANISGFRIKSPVFKSIESQIFFSYAPHPLSIFSFLNKFSSTVAHNFGYGFIWSWTFILFWRRMRRYCVLPASPSCSSTVALLTDSCENVRLVRQTKKQNEETLHIYGRDGVVKSHGNG